MLNTRKHIFRDAPLYIKLLNYRFGYVLNLMNSVDNEALAERFHAVQPLVQITYINYNPNISNFGLHHWGKIKTSAMFIC
jgi:hypothetical protein